MTYVHVVTSDFHDIGHEKIPCRAALVCAACFIGCVFGLLIGSPVWGAAADKFGRKKVSHGMCY